jgi:hypothetical protein
MPLERLSAENIVFPPIDIFLRQEMARRMVSPQRKKTHWVLEYHPFDRIQARVGRVAHLSRSLAGVETLFRRVYSWSRRNKA